MPNDVPTSAGTSCSLNTNRQPLDPAKREALEAYVARRKEQLPEAWY